MNIGYHFEINHDGNNYSFDLIQSNQTQDGVILDGRNYSLHIDHPNDAQIINLFLKRVRFQPSTTFLEFVTQLQHQPAIQKVHYTSIEKAQEIASLILAPSDKVSSPLISKDKPPQWEVENLISPKIPLPGIPIQPMTIEDRMKNLGVPGISIAVINHGEIEWSAAYGELKKPVLIQAASISKTITALTILSLVDQCQKTRKEGSLTGLSSDAYLDLDTDISPFFDTDLWDAIDPRHQTWRHQLNIDLEGQMISIGFEKTTDPLESLLSIGGIHYALRIDNPQLRRKIEPILKQAASHSNSLTEMMEKIKAMPSVKKIEFQSNEITIRRLLSHTAGTSVGGFDGYPRKEVIDKEIAELEMRISEMNPSNDSDLPKISLLREQVLNRRETIKKSFREELLSVDAIIKGKGNSPAVTIEYAPGSKFQYSGGGTTILQQLIEKLTGKSFSESVKKHVLQKLHMDESTYAPIEEQTIQGYDWDCTPVEGRWMKHPELAAAGLWTTPGDLAKVVLAIQKSALNGSFLSKELAAQMLTAQTPSVPNGLGVFVEKTPSTTYFFHEGSNLGFRCTMVGNTEGQGAVIMTNSEYGDYLYEEVLLRIAEAYQWTERDIMPMFKPPISSQEIKAIEQFTFFDPKNWEKYEGSYQFKEHIVELILDQDKVFVKVDQDRPFAVTPISDTLGLFQRTDPGPLQLIRFKMEEGSENNETGNLSLNIFKSDHRRLTKSRL